MTKFTDAVDEFEHKYQDSFTMDDFLFELRTFRQQDHEFLYGNDAEASIEKTDLILHNTKATCCRVFMKRKLSDLIENTTNAISAVTDKIENSRARNYDSSQNLPQYRFELKSYVERATRLHYELEELQTKSWLLNGDNLKTDKLHESISQERNDGEALTIKLIDIIDDISKYRFFKPEVQ